MTTAPDSLDDLVITIDPDATPEEEERFVEEYARAILAVARHVVATQDAPTGDDGLETIEF